jgi:SNW domain-containing protein 1
MASTFSKFNQEVGNKEGRLADRCDEEDDKNTLAGMRKRKDTEDEEAKRERDEIRRMLRKENERNRRREQAGLGKSKNERDQDRDISEKIALGQA